MQRLLILPMPVLWSSALVLQALCQQLSKLVSRALDSADLGSASPDPPTGKRPLRDPPQTPPPIRVLQWEVGGGCSARHCHRWWCLASRKGRLQGSRKPGSGREPSGERRKQPVLLTKLIFARSRFFCKQKKHKRTRRKDRPCN